MQDFLAFGGGREGRAIIHKPCSKRMESIAHKLMGKGADVDGISQVLGMLIINALSGYID